MNRPANPFQFEAAHTQEVGGESILDSDTFSALWELAGEDDPELVADLVALFLADSAGRVREIRANRSATDFDQVGQAAHALKSSSANVGALPFSRICAELEEVTRVGEIGNEGITELIDRTLLMYGEVCVALGHST